MLYLIFFLFEIAVYACVIELAFIKSELIVLILLLNPKIHVNFRFEIKNIAFLNKTPEWKFLFLSELLNCVFNGPQRSCIDERG